MGAPVGNRNRSVQKPWEEAIRRAVLADDGKRLRAIAGVLLTKAENGDIAALKEIGDRLDGKAKQALIGGGDDDPPIVISRIERVIVDSQD